MGENFFGKSAKTTDEWHNTETKSLKNRKNNELHPFLLEFLVVYIYDNIASLYPYLKRNILKKYRVF